MTVNKESIEKALAILEKRATDETRSIETTSAYQSALDIFKYAIQNKMDCLLEFDY